jgi:hypothetical protein
MGQDIWERISGTGHPSKGCQDRYLGRTERKGCPEHDSKGRAAKSGQPGSRVSWIIGDWTTVQNNRDRTTEQPGKNSQARTARTGQPGQEA